MINENETIYVSPYSYLQLDRLWEKVDNVDYDNLVASAEESVRQYEYCYMMSNYDVLAMISAADALEKTDADRSKKLLEEALKLDEWLIEKEPKDEMIEIAIAALRAAEPDNPDVDRSIDKQEQPDAE